MGIAECATFMGGDEIIWADVPVICSCAEHNFESRMCSGGDPGRTEIGIVAVNHLLGEPS
jgi:hypothetical protein